MIKIGIVTFPKTPEEYVQFAKRNGFEHLEIDMFRHLLETFDSKRISNLKEIASSNSITLSIHTPYTLNPAERLPEIRKAYLNYYKKMIEFTASLDGEWLTAHIGYHIGFPDGKRNTVKRAIESLRFLRKFAKEIGVVLGVENVNPMPPRSELFYIGDSVKEIETIFENSDLESVKFCLDVGHANIAEGVQEYINLFGERIVNVHVHDNRGMEDEHLPLGKGKIDWKRVLRLLKKANYNGPLNLEIYKDEEKIESKNYICTLLHEL